MIGTLLPGVALVDLLNRVIDGADDLAMRGYLYDPDPPHEWAQDPGEAFTELAGLAASCRLCRTGPSSLGDHWLDLQQAKWWAKQPTMTCPCGTVYKMLGDPGGEQEFYPDDGGARTGFIRVNAKGKVTSSGKCPCGRAFAETIALQNARMMQYAAPVKPGKRDEPAHATAPEGALF
jgi:hypothetical protein